MEKINKQSFSSIEQWAKLINGTCMFCASDSLFLCLPLHIYAGCRCRTTTTTTNFCAPCGTVENNVVESNFEHKARFSAQPSPEFTKVLNQAHGLIYHFGRKR